jgi:hypothetical protein
MRLSKLRKRGAPLLALVGVLVTAPTAIHAQEAGVGVPSPRESLVRLFSGLSPNDGVQIVTQLLFIENGAFERVGHDSVRVTQYGVAVPVNLDEIVAVSIRSGHGLQGSLWGSGAGILIGTVVGSIVASFGCTTVELCKASERQGAIRLGVFLGVVCASAGFVIGRRARYWKPVFP